MASLIPFRRKKPPVDEFETLLEREVDGLYRVALRYTRDAAQAEDLVHDTALRALRFRDKFAVGTNFKAWIYTILTNTFIHRYRRNQRERQILEGTCRDDVRRQLGSAEALYRASYPEQAYLDHMLSDDVLKALDALPDDFRSVVVLCDVEGLTYRDIAEVLECPVGTVMSRLYRGRRLLERKLGHVAAQRGILKSASLESGEVKHQEGVPSADRILDMGAFRRRKNG